MPLVLLNLILISLFKSHSDEADAVKTYFRLLAKMIQPLNQ